MTFSLVGVGVLIEQYPAAFSILKWVGAAYLVAIGLYAIVTAKAPAEDGSATKTIKPAAAFWGTFAITAITFRRRSSSSSPSRRNSCPPMLDYWMQAGMFFLTFCVVVALSDGFYAVAASWVASFLKGPRVHVWSQRVGGAVLVAAGVATATLNA